MTKKIIILLACLFLFQEGYSSKLSQFIEKQRAKNEAREASEYREDLNFADLAFRLKKRYTNEHGDRCRDYSARSRSNPYRQGMFTICDER